MTPGSKSGHVDLFNLVNAAARGSAIGSVDVGNGEEVSPDAFRCMPYGTFCAFSTINDASGDATLWNVSASDASLISKTPISGGYIENIHMDHTTGAVYSLLHRGTHVFVVSILNKNVEILMDLTPYLTSNFTIGPGASTQCSDTNTIWVAVKTSTGVPDRIIVANMPKRNVTKVIELETKVPGSLWAECINKNDQNTLGGAEKYDQVVSYVQINDDGQSTEVAKATLPETGLELSKLLSEPPGHDYFFTVYPKDSSPKNTNVTGYVAIGDFKQGSTLQVSKIDYYLTGAAAIKF